MLSAIAARRAALASQHNEAPDSNLPVASGSTPTPPPASQSPRSKSSKRKPPSQKTRPASKKSRKLKPFEKSNHGRPADTTDLFEDQAEMIEVASEEEEDGSDSAMSVLEDPEVDLLPQSSKNAAGKRAWSPSQPLEDSSDEEDDDDAVVPLDVTSLLPHLSRSLRQSGVDQEEEHLLSTFDPRPGHTLFTLTDEECRQLGLSSKAVLLALNDGDSVCLLGTCTLAVLHGSIDLFGTTVSASSKSYPIYAPRSAPLPVLRPAMNASSSLENSFPGRLNDLAQFKAVIALQELKTSVEGLGLVCRTFEDVFRPSRWQKSTTKPLPEVSGLHIVRQQTKECHAFSLPPTWSTALDTVIQASDNALPGSYVIKGPKNSGKSTFARTLTNRLLQSYRHVAFLECDLGQSEFTPGGMVSLNIVSEPIFGPPFTHPTLPNYAHFIGSNTPRSSPSHYLDAILALIQTYRLDIQTPALDDDDDDDPRISDAIPIVVNTMGWSKGLGADLTQKIESMLEPTDVFDIQAPTRDDHAFWTPSASNDDQRNAYAAYHDQSMMERSSARVHILESIIHSSALSGYTAADHRSLSILSYFHAQFPLETPLKEFGQVTASSWDVSRPLCAIPPFQVDCSVAFDKIILTGAGSEDVVEEEIGRVLNGAIVAFVRCEPGTVDLEPIPSEASSDKATGIPYSRYQAPPSPASSQCVGLGLIRGVSPPFSTSGKENSSKITTYLQILTPLPHSLLVGCRILVKGEMELPVWGMLDFRNFDGKDADMGRVGNVERDNVPYLQWGKAPEGALGADRRRVRRNLMRRGQM